MDPAAASIAMIIICIGSSRIHSIDMLLEHANVVPDPRIIDGYGEFSFSVKGRTLTITRIDQDGGWKCGFYLRAYLQSDGIPDFTSTVYTYHGLRNEEAPIDVTKVIFAPSVNIIQMRAFYGCRSLVAGHNT